MKITVICRVEPGCLGPDGADHVEDFCQYAQKQFNQVDTDAVDWEIIPRFDKTLDEVQYKLKSRILSDQQTGLYLKALGKDQNLFEDVMFQQLTDSVNRYLNR